MAKITHDQLIEKGIFDEAIKGAKTLRVEYEKLFKELQKQIVVKIQTQQGASPNSKIGQDLIRQTTKEIGALEKVVQNYQKNIGRAAELQNQLTAAQHQYNTSSAETRRAIMREAEILRQKTEAEKQDIKVLSQKEGTLGRLRAELAKQKSILVNDTKMNTKAWDDQVRKVNALNEAVKKAEASVGQYNRNVGNYPQTFFSKVQAGWLAIGAAIGAATVATAKIIGFFKDAAKEAMAVQSEQDKLLMALNGNVTVYDRMNTFASEMEQKTLFEDKDILKAEQMAIALGRTEEETIKMVKVAMALSRVTGTDLQSSMIQLQGTFEGSTGRLAKFAGEIKNLSEEDLRAGKAVDLLYDKIGRFASQGLNTAEGRITMFQKAIGNLKEAIGNLLLPMVSSLAIGFTNLIDKVTEFFSLSESDSIRQQHDEMKSLVSQITSLNEGNKLRKSLIEELISKYPEYFSGIDAEKTKNSELLGMLNKVNDAYEKRIQMAVYGEELAGLEKRESQIRDQQIRQLKQINEYYDKYVDKSKQVKGATVQEQLAALKEVAPKNTSFWTGQGTAFKTPESANLTTDVLSFEARWKELESLSKAIDFQKRQVTSQQSAFKQRVTEEEQKVTEATIKTLQEKKELTREEKNILATLLEQERVRKVAEAREKISQGKTLTKTEQKLLKDNERLQKQQEKAVNEQLKTDEKYFEVRRKMGMLSVTEEVNDRKTQLIQEGVWKKMTIEEQNRWELMTMQEIVNERSQAEMKAYEEVVKKQKEDKEALYQYQLKLGLKTWEEIYQHEIDQYTQAKEYIEANPIHQRIMLEQIQKKAAETATKEQKKLTYDEIQNIETNESFQPEFTNNVPVPEIPKGNWENFTDGLAKQLDKIQAFANSAINILSSVSNSYQQKMEEDLKVVDKRYTKEYDALDYMLDSKLISEKEYNKQKAELDKKKAKEEETIRRESAKKQQKISIIQAIINTALGVTGALAASATLGPIVAGIMAALIAVAGAVEVATIASQTFAKGGHGEIDKQKGGVLVGERHSKGGIKLPGIGEAEDGEYFGITSRESTRKYRKILPTIFETLNNRTFEKIFKNDTERIATDHLIQETNVMNSIERVYGSKDASRAFEKEYREFVTTNGLQVFDRASEQSAMNQFFLREGITLESLKDIVQFSNVSRMLKETEGAEKIRETLIANGLVKETADQLISRKDAKTIDRVFGHVIENITDRDTAIESLTSKLAVEAIKNQQVEKNYQSNLTPLIQINAELEDRYIRKIYEEMTKRKPIKSVQVLDGKIITSEGNHTVITTL